AEPKRPAAARIKEAAARAAVATALPQADQEAHRHATGVIRFSTAVSAFAQEAHAAWKAAIPGSRKAKQRAAVRANSLALGPTGRLIARASILPSMAACVSANPVGAIAHRRTRVFRRRTRRRAAPKRRSAYDVLAELPLRALDPRS